MFTLPIIRLVAFGILFICSIVVLGICASFVSRDLQEGQPDPPAFLGLAVGVVTILAIIPAVIISLARKGAFVTIVWVELVYVGILWALWTAVTAYITTIIGNVICEFTLFPTLCGQIKIAEAVSWVAWANLTVYLMLVITFSTIAAHRGNSRAWTSSVVDTDFLARPKNIDYTNMGNFTSQTSLPVHQNPSQQQLYVQPTAVQVQMQQTGSSIPQIPSTVQVPPQQYNTNVIYV